MATLIQSQIKNLRFRVLFTLILTVGKFNFATTNCFDIAIAYSYGMVFLVSSLHICHQSLMLQIRHFLTDLAKIWGRNLILDANFNFEAIF